MKFFILIFLSLFPLVGLSADFERLNDEEIKALRSEKTPVVINFWATWCQPCQSEIPALNRLHKQYTNVRFVGINVDDRENRGAIKGFLKKYPINYEIFLRDGKDFEQMAASFQENWKAGLPATFLFADGKKIYEKLGEIQEQELDKALENIHP